jgi:biotin transport system substrate-specific component
MTMQTFVVLVLGMAYGWRLAGATVLLYLAQGALGLPVFAAGGGIAYFAGPTAGYLVGFLLATVAVGWLADHGWDRSVLRTLAAMLIGTVIIFACGIAWLSTLIGLPQAIGAGLVPFLLGEAAKIALATAILPFAWRLLQRS